MCVRVYGRRCVRQLVLNLMPGMDGPRQVWPSQGGRGRQAQPRAQRLKGSTDMLNVSLLHVLLGVGVSWQAGG